jgi:hypothetical protein
VKHNAWPDYPSSDDLLYLGSRAKAFMFDWPKNSLLQEQSEHFSKANLMIEREQKHYLLYDQN